MALGTTMFLKSLFTPYSKNFLLRPKYEMIVCKMSMFWVSLKAGESEELSIVIFAQIDKIRI